MSKQVFRDVKTELCLIPSICLKQFSHISSLSAKLCKFPSLVEPGTTSNEAASRWQFEQRARQIQVCLTSVSTSSIIVSYGDELVQYCKRELQHDTVCTPTVKPHASKTHTFPGHTNTNTHAGTGLLQKVIACIWTTANGLLTYNFKPFWARKIIPITR